MHLRSLLDQGRISRNFSFLRRWSHTDLKVPDFSKDMRASVSEPNCVAAHADESRKLFTYLMSSILSTCGMYGTKAEIIRYVKFMDVAADELALAKIEINLDAIPEGVNATFKWRSKPLFVWHRPDQAIEAVRQIPLRILRDPEQDEDRVKDPKWLVCLGVCTHLRCVPVPHQGDYGGYYCPCHGAHFDISGRTRKGPAPTNLEVPPYTISGSMLIVGFESP